MRDLIDMVNPQSENTQKFSSEKYYKAAPKNFQNLNPPIDVDLSKYLEKNLEELEAQERSKVKQQDNFEKTPKGKKKKQRKISQAIVLKDD